MNRTVHVISRPRGRWAVRRAAAYRAVQLYQTREDAVVAGEMLARKEKCTLYIHNADGSVEQRNEYEQKIPTPGTMFS